MLNLFSMMGNYEARKVDRFENGLFTIDTALVTDRELPYETAIAHKDFNNGEWIILVMEKLCKKLKMFIHM